MKQRALLPVLTALVALAGCVGPGEPPPPAAVPVPAPRPMPSPSPAPLPQAADWRDWPVSPGNWRIERRTAGPVAIYGASASPLLMLSCRAGIMKLDRPGAGGNALTIRTTSLTRTLGTTTLQATDPLLDAMGFSRGRFVVESAGSPPLVVPAWPETLRVVEECRR